MKRLLETARKTQYQSRHETNNSWPQRDKVLHLWSLWATEKVVNSRIQWTLASGISKCVLSLFHFEKIIVSVQCRINILRCWSLFERKLGTPSNPFLHFFLFSSLGTSQIGICRPGNKGPYTVKNTQLVISMLPGQKKNSTRQSQDAD